jgi:hypothetical protein
MKVDKKIYELLVCENIQKENKALFTSKSYCASFVQLHINEKANKRGRERENESALTKCFY